MKKKIEIILDEARYNGLPTHIVADQLLDLFSVRLSLLVEKQAAGEATERYAHIQGVDYGNGLEHGFESGAEWVVEKLKRNEA